MSVERSRDAEVEADERTRQAAKLTKEGAALLNCKQFAQARNGKAAQLEREIQASSATAAEKANMLHTLSKLGIFAADERDQLVRIGTPHAYYSRWLAGETP